MQSNNMAPTLESFVGKVKLLSQSNTNTLVLSKHDATTMRDEIIELLLLIANLSKELSEKSNSDQVLNIEIESKF